MGGASTGAASSAVSIPLLLPCKTSSSTASKVLVHRRCPRLSWHPWCRGWQWPEMVLSIMCWAWLLLPHVPPEPDGAEGDNTSWRGIILRVQCGRNGMHLPEQNTSCFSPLFAPPLKPSPWESKGSLGWKPGLSVAHAEEKPRGRDLFALTWAQLGLSQWSWGQQQLKEQLPDLCPEVLHRLGHQCAWAQPSCALAQPKA